MKSLNLLEKIKEAPEEDKPYMDEVAAVIAYISVEQKASLSQQEIDVLTNAVGILTRLTYLP